jgi:hypothetical protein
MIRNGADRVTPRGAAGAGATVSLAACPSYVAIFCTFSIAPSDVPRSLSLARRIFCRKFPLTPEAGCNRHKSYPCGSPSRAIGKTVRVRHGPAAVTGDKGRLTSLSGKRMGRRGRRMIRKPEDLPAGCPVLYGPRGEGSRIGNGLRMKYGIPTSEGAGIFYFEQLRWRRD